MHSRKLHLHPMLVHSVLALVPLAAVAFALDAAAVGLGGFGPEVWRFLAAASPLQLLAAVAYFATLTVNLAVVGTFGHVGGNLVFGR